MNKLFLFFSLISTLIVSSQNKNDCYEFMKYEQNQNFKDTIFLSNGSFLYYNWSCDSTWFTFENNKKTILKSCSNEDPILCSRLGLNFVKEYPNFLLFKHNWLSGCCSLPDLVFVDKKTGKVKSKISKHQLIHQDIDQDYALYFKDTAMSEISLLNLKSNKINYQKINKQTVLNSIKTQSLTSQAQLFKNFKLEDSLLTFDFYKTEEDFHKIKMVFK